MTWFMLTVESAFDNFVQEGFLIIWYNLYPTHSLWAIDDHEFATFWQIFLKKRYFTRCSNGNAMKCWKFSKDHSHKVYLVLHVLCSTFGSWTRLSKIRRHCKLHELKSKQLLRNVFLGINTYPHSIMNFTNYRTRHD